MKIQINFDEMQDKRKLYDTLKSLHGKYEIAFKKVRDNRSLSQNNYYWGVVLPYALEAVNNEGNEWNLDDLHDFFKSEFLKDFKVIIIDNLARQTKTVKSTSELNTKEFTDYIDRIVRWCAEQFGAEIPSA